MGGLTETPPGPEPPRGRRAAPPQVKGGKLYVNGVARVEPFINEPPAYTLGKLVVPPGDVSRGGAVMA
jgi:hypothetical protein